MNLILLHMVHLVDINNVVSRQLEYFACFTYGDFENLILHHFSHLMMVNHSYEFYLCLPVKSVPTVIFFLPDFLINVANCH